MKTTVHDIFKISSIPILGAEEHYSLVQMYMPIIGIDSYSLYTILCTLKVNDKYSFKKLIDSLNLKSLDLLKNAFEKLEAVSLIKSFHHEQKGYLFQILPPLSRRSFLKNTLLSSFLTSQIGEVEFNALVSQIKLPIVRAYQEITKSFDEIYTVKTDNINDLFGKIFKFKDLSQVNLKNPNFDYIFFKMNFDSNFIDEKILDDEEFKQQILNISYTYQLNEEEMKDIVLKTITVDQDLKYEDISKNARHFYQKKNISKEPRFVTKAADEFVSSEIDDETFRFIEAVENTPPSVLLQDLNGGIKPSVSELKMIEDLVNNTKFPLSIINIMLLLVNEEKKGVLPGYNYFEKIANTWARAKIKTPLDVIKYINKEKPQEKKIYNTRKKSEAPLPEWYTAYENQLEKIPKEEEQELSEEEIEKILEEAKKFN